MEMVLVVITTILSSIVASGERKKRNYDLNELRNFVTLFAAVQTVLTLEVCDTRSPV